MINLCKIFGHNYKHYAVKEVEDTESGLVDEIIYIIKCKRCNRKEVSLHFIWNKETWEFDEIEQKKCN